MIITQKAWCKENIDAFSDCSEKNSENFKCFETFENI